MYNQWSDIPRKIRALIVQEIKESNRSYTAETFDNAVRLNVIHIRKDKSFILKPHIVLLYNSRKHNGHKK